MSLLDAVSSRLGPDAIGALARQIGADESSTRTGVSAALPMLVAALARNASKGEGASALHGALTRDHDGSILDDVLGAFSSSATGSTGDGILRHVLGGHRPGVEQGLSQVSGLSTDQGARLLALLAPLVLGALGRQQRGGGLDAGGLADLLGGQRRQAADALPQGAGGLLGLLDRDGDGSVADDVGRIGLGMLGGLLGGRDRQ